MFNFVRGRGKDSKALLVLEAWLLQNRCIEICSSGKRVLINPHVPAAFRHPGHVRFMRNHQEKLSTINSYINVLSNRWSNMDELCPRDPADSLQRCFRDAANGLSPFCIAATVWRVWVMPERGAGELCAIWCATCAEYKCSVLFWGHGVMGGVRAKAASVSPPPEGIWWGFWARRVGLKSVNGCDEKTILQQSFSPRYSVLQGMCPRALFCASPDLFSPHLAFGPSRHWGTVVNWKQRVMASSPLWTWAHHGAREPAGHHTWKGEAVPLGADSEEGRLCPPPHLETSLCSCWLRGARMAAPGTASGLTCVTGCGQLKTLVPQEQNQKILQCRKRNEGPVAVCRITVIHPSFLPGFLHSYHGGAGRLRKYMCK